MILDSKPTPLAPLGTRADLSYAPVRILELLTHSAKPAQPERCLIRDRGKPRWIKKIRVPR